MATADNKFVNIFIELKHSFVKAIDQQLPAIYSSLKKHFVRFSNHSAHNTASQNSKLLLKMPTSCFNTGL